MKMTVSIGVGIGDAVDAEKAVQAAVEQARAQLGGAPVQAAYITATVDYEAARVHTAFREALAGVPLHGVTTSLGVLTAAGVRNEGHGALAVMLVGGAPGTAFVASSTEADGRRAGEAAARALVRKAGGKPPRMILFNASPGMEEAMLEGIASVCPDVPCQGGSAADHAIAGQWSVFTHEGPVPAGVSLLGLFGEMRVGTALSTPYSPTGVAARATGAEGRTLLTLDGQPAAQVLGRWLEGAIDDQVRSGGNILAQTALRPIAVRRGVSRRDHYVTVHPAHVHADRGSVDVFARIEPQDEVCLMTGTAEGLVNDVAHLIDMALAQGGLNSREVKGAALIFCAGCAGALGPRVDEGLRTFSRLLPGVPLLGLCTFGEQGYIPGLGNVHQDLSLSLTLFADPRP
ncbi:FIST C-terminal domain-containing protein [Archangium gephyra]|uniref:FIST signal transduction protein n=1 Tax=Archangium gephyra TaxID=48 RepID=UPI0035D43B44